MGAPSPGGEDCLEGLKEAHGKENASVRIIVRSDPFEDLATCQPDHSLGRKVCRIAVERFRYQLVRRNMPH